MQDTNFHNAWGPSESTCTAGLAQLCTAGCAGKQVNAAAQTQCFSDINTQSCSTVADGSLGNSCAAVCVDVPTGAGGAGGAGGSGAGGSSGGGTLSDPIVFCKMSFDAICARVFQCVPAAQQTTAFTAEFGTSVAACKTMFEAMCIDPATNCPTYSPTLGASCISMLNSDTCADLLATNFVPATCQSACGM